MLVLVPFTLALALTVWLSALLMKVGKDWLLDFPADRKIHERPVPRTGGLAIGLAFFLFTFIFNLESSCGGI